MQRKDKLAIVAGIVIPFGLVALALYGFYRIKKGGQ